MSRITRVLGLAVVAAVVFTFIQASGRAADDGDSTEAKYTIKEVMKKAHKDKLLNKVLDGSATHEQEHELLDLYLSLVENEPPKGDMQSWHTMAGGAVLAAAKVVVGREGAKDELKKASNCGACHKAHKGS